MLGILNGILEHALPLGNDALVDIKRCLVIAPHPDDESLGCGGLLALLRKGGTAISVIFTTDGSMSHPKAKIYTDSQRAEIREQEALNALKVLGIAARDVYFLRGKDSALPTRHEKGFERYSLQISSILEMAQPDLLLIPYALDPHRDHRASSQMAMHALSNSHSAILVWEYLIWLYELGEREDIAPLLENRSLCYCPLPEWARTQKRDAIAQHTSQLLPGYFDDPEGFILTPKVLAYFDTDREYFLKRQ